MVDLGDARSFQKRSLNETHDEVRMNTCDAIMERKMFVFSLVSSSFSLCVRAVREHHLGPRAPLDSEKQSTSHMQWTQSPEGPSKTSHEAGGGGGGRSSASGCFPREAPTVPVAVRQAKSLAPPLSTPLPKFEPFYL